MGELEGVYWRARYCVGGDAPFVMRVGQYSDALRGLMEVNGCQTAAFLTAANPGGVKIPDTENLQAELRLASEITSRGFSVLPGIGLDDDKHSDWPGERSVLVLGISYQDAVLLGQAFGQLAILWCPATAVPELLMLKR